MRYKDFGIITEEEILKNCPKVIADIKSEFNLIDDRSSTMDSTGVEQSKGYARVLTKDSGHVSKTSVSYEQNNQNSGYSMGGYSIDGDIRQNSGASYVLVIAALIALVILVYVVASTILKMVNGIY